MGTYIAFLILTVVLSNIESVRSEDQEKYRGLIMPGIVEFAYVRGGSILKSVFNTILLPFKIFFPSNEIPEDEDEDELNITEGSFDCGIQAQHYQQNLFPTTRIIGGNESHPHSWPWHVFFQSSSFFIFTPMTCGASLIRVDQKLDESDILVTASHCVTDSIIPFLDFLARRHAVAGKHDLGKREAGEQVRGVATFLRKEGFVPSLGRNDIALVKLDKPIKFTRKIRPICLPEQDEELPIGKKCVVTGWGRNDSSNPFIISQVLKQLAVEVHNDSTCLNNANGGWEKMTFMSLKYASGLTLCAGPLDGTESACEGDSGGPLACQANGLWTLYGIVSFGTMNPTCLQDGSPPVFARVSNYATWIKTNAADLTSVGKIQ